MTLQQLEYILAVDRHRHFVRAAEECGVSQPTLSALINKLEEELDVKIFDRTRHPVEPTLIGQQILRQARVTLNNSAQLKEIVLARKETLATDLNLAIIPTVAPYIVPGFIERFQKHYTQVNLRINEMRTQDIIAAVKAGSTDMALLATPLQEEDILEIPVYYEKFVAYIAPSDPNYNKEELAATDLPTQHLWVLQEGHCLRNQIFNFCTETARADRQVYEAGSIETLVKIIDRNGGYTPHSPAAHSHVDRPAAKAHPPRNIASAGKGDFHCCLQRFYQGTVAECRGRYHKGDYSARNARCQA